MKTIVSGRNIDLTKAIKDHVTEKFDKLDHHFDFIQEIHVFLSVEKNPKIKDKHLAEATVHVSGAIVRVEIKSENLYASIDDLVRKVDRSMKKHKTKLLRRSKRDHISESIRKQGFEEAVAQEDELEEVPEEEIFLTFMENEGEETEKPNTGDPVSAQSSNP